MSATRGRGGTSTQTVKRDHKKKCELGKACPYQDPHKHVQHLMEFSHDTSPKKPKAFVGSGRKLGAPASGSAADQRPGALQLAHRQAGERVMRLAGRGLA